jgi:hypothetical protein
MKLYFFAEQKRILRQNNFIALGKVNVVRNGLPLNRALDALAE